MSAVQYKITLNPGTTARMFGVGITDLDGTLWQFWGGPSFDTVAIFQGDSESPDFRPSVRGRSRDFFIDLRTEEIDPSLITDATVRRLANRWTADRNRMLRAIAQEEAN